MSRFMSSGTALAPQALDRAANTGPSRRISHSSLVLGVILTCQLMVVLDATIVNVALPQMQQALGFSGAGLSWVLNAYTLTFGGLLLLGARAGDLLGRRRTFIAGIAVFILASLLGGFAPAAGWLLAARALQGVGGALAAPSSLALLTTMFTEPRERIRALGLFTAVSVGGGALGLIMGGMLTEWASWRWVMFVNVPIGLAVILVGRAVLPETPRNRGTFDLPGAVFSTLGMGALVYGFVRAAASGWGDVITLSSFVSGVVLLTAFVLTELRAEQPITPLRLFNDRSRTLANVSRGLLFAGMFGLFFFLTQFLQDVLGYSSLKTGFAFLPLPVTVFVVSQLTSRVLIHRVHAKALMLVGVTLGVTGFALATQLDPGSSYPHVLAALLLFAVGNGLSFVPLTQAALEGVPAKDAGAASGLVNVTQQLGGTLGVAILVTVFGHYSRQATTVLGDSAHAQAQHVFTAGASHAFGAAAVFLLAALVLVAAGVRAPGTSPAPAAPASEH
ncbi:MAG TPA: MFS transporter [Actinomycetes bacterium]|nr:MFS transporter [Actinomycetes bacterium]